ncbi:uncharacterized protein METZ01_LOCUS67912 [marine metagenome]|uniref:Uncharacterized protein n=1 Tax=marine metagenome TaxID=408172 RepID=A0A381THM9_9ZZZZ|tara:strand:- start:12 stop:371 length:360 start_codon:yes stop_codon:yes gene_type:complete
MSNTILGKDAYWMNFFGLMVLTLIEVGAVGADLGPTAGGFDMTERQLTLWILTIIAIPKFMMIAAIFMHLWGENDSGILTLTALFPAFFIIIMVLFIGLTHPEGATGLPAWCRPGTYGL